MTQEGTAGGALFPESFRFYLHGQRVARQVANMQTGVMARYTVAPGDTFISIAQMYYGSQAGDMVGLIPARNSILPNTDPPVGFVLTIPSLSWRVR